MVDITDQVGDVTLIGPCHTCNAGHDITLTGTEGIVAFARGYVGVDIETYCRDCGTEINHIAFKEYEYLDPKYVHSMTLAMEGQYKPLEVRFIPRSRIEW